MKYRQSYVIFYLIIFGTNELIIGIPSSYLTAKLVTYKLGRLFISSGMFYSIMALYNVAVFTFHSILGVKVNLLH